MAVHALYYYAGPVLHSTATLFQQQHCEVHSWTSSTLATRSLCVSPQNGRNTCLHYAQKLLTPVEIFVALQNPIQKWHSCHNLVTTLLLFVVVWNDIQQSCQEKVKESCTAANEDMKKFGRSRDYMMKRLTDTDIKKLIERTWSVLAPVTKLRLVISVSTSDEVKATKSDWSVLAPVTKLRLLRVTDQC